MASEDRFKQNVVATLAKRAANRCSNPDCGAITSGPADNPSESVNVGEAAHIFGANSGSARYDSSMESSDRGSIENAIWLCGNCHKLVDDDPTRYPAGLLFEWQREHERRIVEMVGKAGAEIRQRYEERHLEEFGRLSYLAERLVLEKGKYWEYRLTAEVLRFETAPLLRRWSALSRGLYMKPNRVLNEFEVTDWLSMKMDELKQVCGAISELLNVEFARAWGPLGTPGNDIEIVATCRLFAEMCESALTWEESVRFVKLSAAFDSVQALLVGVAGRFIDEAARFPEYLSKMFSKDPEPGKYGLNLELTLPDGWAEAVERALHKAIRG